MARRKSPKNMTDVELRAAIAELDAEWSKATEAANWDDRAPEPQRIEALMQPYVREQSARFAATQAAAKAERDAKAKKKSSDAAKAARAKSAGGRFAARPEDREAVLREALKAHVRAEEGKSWAIFLGGRPRREQQAMRDLAADGLLEKVGRGHQSFMTTRNAEQYGGQSFIITQEGEAHIRKLAADKGEKLPEKGPAKKPAASIKVTPRPEPKEAPDPVQPVEPREGAQTSPSARLAAARYEDVQGRSRAAVGTVQDLWRDVTPDRLLSAMQGQTGRSILNAVIAGQLSVAQGAQSFVTASMMAQGVGLETLGGLIPGSLAGLAADGRSLATLLYLPAITAARALTLGMSPEAASLMGLNQMAMLVSTTLADTARTATSVAMTAEPRCISYVRVVKLPACSRCIILAGRQYSYSEGFKRHPKCDCGMEPMSDKEWRSRETKSPEDLFKAMSPEERRNRFGEAGATAIEMGADINQVVNVRREGAVSTTTTGKKVTTEGVTRRGIGGQSLSASGFEKVEGKRLQRVKESRLMPEQILKQAEGDRGLQIALLKKHGYIS